MRTIPASAKRLLVFDLDGTLIDSGPDLCAAVNAMLRHFARPMLPQQVIAGYVGDGALALVRRALGEAAESALLDTAMSYFLDYYHEHKLDRTRVYPGVFDSLDELRHDPEGAERVMAVLTNKPIVPAQVICDALGLSPYFFRIYGGNSFPTKKPDPEGLRKLIQEAGVTPQETLMIGDSPADVLAARQAGVGSVGCRYGLTPAKLAAAEPDCLVDSAEEWPSALQNGCAALPSR